MNTEREVERFEVVTREGKEYTVVVTQEINSATTQTGMMTMPGMKKMTTLEEGCRVNKTANGTFLIVETGEVAVRISEI